jgi:uncharacterized membrane protein YgdD (TMEM256/DUF423 family)
MRNWILGAAFSGAMAVILGALGAHALKAVLPEAQLSSFETGVRYHIYHTIAILLTVVIAKQFHVDMKWPLRLFALGTVMFSGSIYLLATIPLHGIEALRSLGPVTPIGGVMLIAGWFIMALRIRKSAD